ncbi:MAG: di-trans,poly-cis-decaprenylcistransferase [Oscillospiraceae bacterium]|nr:di-trans,poly-cis-decaprenylcistransferase [Oscillospiraceae bacterium]
MALFQKEARAGAAEALPLPRHIAVIMDGNGRWAKKRGLPRTAGHAAGVETFRRVATYCKNLGMDYLTVYAFSTENWKRPPEEVDAIMKLLEKYLGEAIEKMERDGIRLKFFGDTSVLAPKLRGLIRETDEISTRVRGFQANVCVNYGGRAEILRAAQSWAQRVQQGETGELTEEVFGSLLYSAGIPDPELMIRPGREQRISNYLLWQLAYTEFYFTETLWPDFDGREIDRAIEAYRSRERRFGALT